MTQLYIGLAALAAAHAFFFGRWLIKNGNRPGAWCAFTIAAVCIALPVYRYVTAP